MKYGVLIGSVLWCAMIVSCSLVIASGDSSNVVIDTDRQAIKVEDDSP